MKYIKEKGIRFLKKNWMKVGLIAILLFILFKKDFSFQINFNTPLQQQEDQHLPVKQSKKNKKQELFTDNNTEQSTSNKSAVLDHLKVPFWGSSKKKTTPQYLSQLMKVNDEKYFYQTLCSCSHHRAKKIRNSSIYHYGQCLVKLLGWTSPLGKRRQ